MRFNPVQAICLKGIKRLKAQTSQNKSGINGAQSVGIPHVHVGEKRGV